MRLLKIGVYYPTYLEHFYATRPNLDLKTYSTQHSELMYDAFGSSDFWTTELADLGYETCEIVANAKPLQKMWAREQGFTSDESQWLFEITAAQVRAFSPEVLIVADYSTITAPFLRMLRDTCPSVRLILGWCGAPFQDGSIFSECDLVLSCVPELVARFEEIGHRCRHLNHAFDARILERIDVGTTPITEFVFIGSIVRSKQFHLGRERILNRLAKETDLRIWSQEMAIDSAPTSQSPLHIPAFPRLGPLARRAVGLIAGGSNRNSSASTEVDHRIKHRCHPPLFGLTMFQQLRDSKVALNTHIDISTSNASNMRLFEATGVGTCLLTDWKENLRKLFEPDGEVLTYRSTEEAVEKVRYILDHDDERRAVAAAGQARTLRDHNFEIRAAQIDEIICDELHRR